MKPLSTVLILFARYGEGHIQSALLFRSRATCGKNETARAELLQQTAHLSGVHFFGYVKQIAELMKTADLLVTKAGGITLAEAMSLNLTLLLLSPVPGQEMETARSTPCSIRRTQRIRHSVDRIPPNASSVTSKTLGKR